MRCEGVFKVGRRARSQRARNELTTIPTSSERDESSDGILVQSHVTESLALRREGVHRLGLDCAAVPAALREMDLHLKLYIRAAI